MTRRQGTVILHSGMPKAGSTSIQRWLTESAETLRRDHETLLSVARYGPDRVLRIEPYTSGRCNSGDLIVGYEMTDRDEQVLERFFAELDRVAASCRTTVLSSEGFAQLFWRVDEAFLTRLEAFAQRYRVRVAYYVRPQHSALEAAWRQWGFRMSSSPAAYVAERAEQLHYWETLGAVTRLAPSVSFEVRPFVDLLLDGGPAEDFARHFLDVAGATSARRWSNRGLPLELVNMLRAAPAALVGADVFDNRAIARLQQFGFDTGTTVSDKIRRSREVLRSFAHETFEASNRELIAGLGWPIDGLVPDGSAPGGPWSLSELDALWTPDASAAEIALLLQAIAKAIGPAG